MLLEATTANGLEKYLTPIFTGAVVGLGTVATQWLNHRRGKKKDLSGNTALTRIEQKLDGYQAETRETCRLLTVQINEVAGVAEDALSQCIGPAPDRKNGLKSRISDLEKWQEAEALRERHRLEQLERDREMDLRLGPDRRVPKPTDVGTLTPRTI